MSKRASLGTCASVLLAISLTGCPNLRPNWFHPGPAEAQRFRAIQHDPYPDQQSAPPVVGGRPLDYRSGVAEPVRNQPYPQGGVPVVPAPGI